MWEKKIQKTIYTLAVNDWCPEITELTFPLFQRYADKIGADFYVISERKNPDWPITYEKFQIYDLAQEHENDWNIYLDADALIHPETPDFTLYLNKNEVSHTAQDAAPIRWKYDRFFLRDGRDIGSCFEAGTFISGSNTPIESLVIGSEVSNYNGTAQKVTNTFSKLYSGNMVSLKVACMPSIKVTGEHPILVCPSKFKYYTGKHPLSGIKNWKERIFLEPIWKNAEDISVGDYVQIPRIKENIIENISFTTQGGGSRNKGLKKTITVPLDEDIAWLLGLYVAEGYISENNRINLSINSNESILANKAIDTFNKIGINARIQKSPSMVGVQVIVVSCADLARLFDSWCGHGAENKQVPSIIMQSPENIIRAFLDGLIEGDGCYYKTKKGNTGYRLVTISKKLVFDVISLSHKIGIHVSANEPRKNTSTIEGRKVNTNPIYEVNWSHNSWNNIKDKQNILQKGHAVFKEGFVYLPIRKIVHTEVKDIPVYNIETEDHTYGVPFTVHNCNWFTIGSDWCIDLWHPTDDLTPQECIDRCYPTVPEEKSGVITPYHLIDDFLIGRNIAKFGLKFKTMKEIIEKHYPGSDFFWHQYTMPPAQKVIEMKKALQYWGLL